MNLTQKKKYESVRQLKRQANILAATREMLAEIGYDKTTIRALAEKADVAPGTLYNLYNSKDELVLAAVQDLLLEVRGTTREQSAEGLDRFITQLALYGATVQSNPAYAEAMTRALFGTQKHDRLREMLYTGNIEHGAYHLSIAIDQGHIDPRADVQSLSKHLQAQNWGVAVAWVMGMVDLDDLVIETLRSVALTLLAVTTPQGEAFLKQLVAKYGVDRWPLG